jgi:uncharacterized membrane protein YdfJ with MMPL/SSD domain
MLKFYKKEGDKMNKSKIGKFILLIVLIGFVFVGVYFIYDYVSNKSKTESTQNTAIEYNKENELDDTLTNENDIDKSARNKKNMEECKDLIDKIETNYQSVKVNSIYGESTDRTLSININLLDNLDSTEYECAKIAQQEETSMKEKGITSINVNVYNATNELQGMIIFNLEDGRYEPAVNTL